MGGYRERAINKDGTYSQLVKLAGSNVEENGLLKTTNVEDYTYNIKHLDGFKAKLKTDSPTKIVPITIEGDSISEGAMTADFTINGYAAIIRDTLQSKYGNAGLGMLTAWRRKTGTPTYVWAMTGTWTGIVWAMMLPQAAAGDITFNGTGFKLFYGAGSSGGLFDVQVDAGSAVSVDGYTTTGTAIKVYTVTGLTNGSHTVKVTAQQAGKTLYLIGIIPISGATGVRVDNFGYWGKQTDTLADTFYKAVAVKENPALTIIAMTANDYEAQIPLTTYKSRLDGAIKNALSAGSSVLLLGNGIRTESRQVEQRWYTQVLYELADENNVALIDINKKWKTGSNAKDTLLYIADTVHPNEAGHKDIANEILKYIFN